MLPRLLPLAVLLAALGAARTAAADDDAAIRRVPYAPIAGTPIPGTMELSTEKKAKYPGLVIAGAVAAGLGAAGLVVGIVLTPADHDGCPYRNVAKEGAPPSYQSDGPCPAQRNLGLTTLSISAAVAAAGLTMVLVGVQPADDAKSPSARLVPSVAVGPTGGVLTWRF